MQNYPKSSFFFFHLCAYHVTITIGYDAEHDVRDIRLQKVQVCGGPLLLHIGEFASSGIVEERV